MKFVFLFVFYNDYTEKNLFCFLCFFLKLTCNFTNFVYFFLNPLKFAAQLALTDNLILILKND